MKQYKKTSTLPLKENTVIRPRIDKLLEQGLQASAVVVSAGAGFGKTQAVASFLERSEYRGVWQQLTALDNLPMRFWESFTHTVSLHRPALADKLETLGFPDSLYDFHMFLRFFTEELYADDQSVVFVFDDFHLITEKSLLNFFSNLLSARLENFCMIFITRVLEWPSFSETPYVITADDLRFTENETKLYFWQQKIDIKSQKELKELYTYTGGWPVALSLVGLQAAKKSLPLGQHLIDSQQLLFKLIEKEVFSEYDEKAQRFFILLSLLNFFPAGLISEIFREENARLLLGSNVFISYDQKAESYYPHRIFLDFLSEKQPSLEAAAVSDVLRKSGDWCRENKYFIDAIHYYERCGAKDRITDVLLGFKGMRHSRDDANLFLRYFENFSEEFLEKNIMCRVVYAMFFLNNLEIEKAQEQMRIVQDQLGRQGAAPENNLMRGEASIGAGLIQFALGDVGFVRLFRRANELLPDGSGHWGENLRLVEYGNALHLASAEKGAAEKYLDRLSDGAPYLVNVLHGTGYGIELLASAENYFLKGSFRDAQKYAYQALYAAKEKEEQDIIDNARFLLLRIFLATGKVSKLNDTLKEIQRNAKRPGLLMQSVSDVALGWFYSEIGELKKVAGWVVYGEEKSRPPISMDKDLLLQIRCLIEKKDFFKALALTERLESILRKRNGLISVLFTLVYRAVILYNLNDPDNCARTLTEAYSLSRDNELILPFIEFGHKTRAMLNFFQKQEAPGLPADWLAAVHAKASTYAKRRAYIASQFSRLTDDTSTDHGLTGREIELLQNMSQGLTRDEIAESMHVSPHTVKSMTKIVYNKMGAVNAADAIRIASNSDLIL